ncbi:ras-related protein Rab-7a-like isoform X3 [Elephas maximus indicus]|uniref:ras-related protein Rab-7a-like isoform X3 n=1 Tax=Elephas maximus indicus TaxID=99487 RepID=UPI002116BA0F|nr:ras-related protein Rab-7a-like isoform X3 [Elephas maximus indicus]
MASAGSSPLKILLVGSAGVGKSSLMSRFVHNRFCSRYRATIGADFFTKVMELEGQRVTVQAVAAQRAEFLMQADPPSPKQFPFVLLGNKTDLPGRQVSPREAEEWCAQTQAQYFETSAKDGTGVALAFHSASQAALRQVLRRGGVHHAPPDSTQDRRQPWGSAKPLQVPRLPTHCPPAWPMAAYLCCTCLWPGSTPRPRRHQLPDHLRQR